LKPILVLRSTRALRHGLLAMLALIAGAHAEAPRIFAITDVRIVPAPGQVIDHGTVVLRDGLIEAVGRHVDAPDDAWIIAGQDDWTVYPAFIDAASSVGLKSEPAGGPPGRPKSPDNQQRPGSPNELDAVHPERAVVDRLTLNHAGVDRYRKLGFAVVQILPATGVFRGESAVILLRDAPARELILADRKNQVIALETSSFMARKYPSSTLGAVATVRQTLLDARRQRVWTERYAANPAGMRHPEYRASDAPLLALLRGEQQVVFVSLRALDPGRFHALTTEFDLHAMTVAAGLADRPDSLRAAGMPVLLPLSLPDKPELSKADDALEITLQEMQASVRAPGLPAALAQAGVEFAFVTAGMKSARDFSGNLAAVVEAGLPPEQALAAVTTVPARLLGMERMLGTIEPGKQANLLIVQGELFTARPVFRHLFVDGYHEKIKAEKTIGDPTAVVDPRGTWEVTSEVMGRRSGSTWEITGSKDNYRGSSESSRAGKHPFKSVELRGNALTVVRETPRGIVDITVVVSEASFTGETTLESPRGSVKMKIEGRRIAGPENNEQ